MPNEEHIKWLREKPESWNKRVKAKIQAGENFIPDFSNINFPKLQSSSSISFKGKILRHGLFTNSNLSEADFIGADLADADFRGASGYKTIFHDACLETAKFSGAHFKEANFKNAVLEDTDLSSATFESVDFQGANFSYAKLCNSRLLNANVKCADLRTANLLDTVISRTQLLDAHLLSDSTLLDSQRGLQIEQKVSSINDIQEVCRSMLEHYQEISEQDGINKGRVLYFRGEYCNSWDLRPSVIRFRSHTNSVEGEMLDDLMTERPNDFVGVDSALSQWVLGQHYGLKTRLLDITQNPLVALFYACDDDNMKTNAVIEKKGSSCEESDGRIHIFAVPRRMIKSYDSDSITIIMNFAKLKRFEQDLLMGLEIDQNEVRIGDYANESRVYLDVLRKLYHLIRREKPNFHERIDIRDLFRVFVVRPQQLFDRIRAQSGAFLVSAYHEQFEQEKIIESQKFTSTYDHFVLTVPRKEKSKLREDLCRFNIKREILFPSLEECAKAIHKRYQDGS